MGKRFYKNYPIRFRERAVERLKLNGNATRLSEELGIHRTTLNRPTKAVENGS
jgi:transposase-like protein